MTGPVSAVPRLDGVAAARRFAGWLALAATPTFAIMALLTALSGGPADAMCGAGQGSLLGGMVPMYLLMSALHSAAWLKLIAVVGARSADKPGVNASSFETRARARSSG
jgi:hypothetical protein